MRTDRRRVSWRLGLAKLALALALGGAACSSPATDRADRSTTTLRPCVGYPRGDIGDIPPNGTYVVRFLPEPDGSLTLYLDNGGAGFTFHDVTVAPDVTLVGYRSGTRPVVDAVPSADRATQAVRWAMAALVGDHPSITVDDGAIDRIDVKHRRWDVDGRGTKFDPATKCESAG